MSEDNPLQPVSDGKDLVSGRFTPGNQCAKGNATPRKAATFRLSCFAPSRPPTSALSCKSWWKRPRPANPGQ